ncbi:hypothetical protein LJR078_000912 [Arthrobacter sp. LjRoot78]|uniref:hypothetical protein n=1 Tax=unclassified Arthrobacter TaxID=235627 RepID=UPI000A76A1A1|nr:hypothetical protein [Arthrobacter sp. Leaf337]
MAQHSTPARLSAKARPASSRPATGLRSWSRGRQIYLAVGILACLAGIMIIAFSR